MVHRVELAPDKAAFVLRHMSPQAKRRMKAALRRLADDPFGAEAGLDVRALRAETANATLYRLRVGHWRAVYRIRPRRVQVIRIFHRRDGYEWLDEA